VIVSAAGSAPPSDTESSTILRTELADEITDLSDRNEHYTAAHHRCLLQAEFAPSDEPATATPSSNC